MSSSDKLRLKSVIGFNGKIPNTLTYTRDNEYVVYPLGTFIVLKHLKSDKEAFLNGHTGEVCAISISPHDQRIASGQLSKQGVKSDVYMWDLDKAKDLLAQGQVLLGESCLIMCLKQHKSKVQALDFSCDGNFLASLGGQDDNSLVIWDVETGEAICGLAASSDSAVCLKWTNNRNDRLVTAGNYHARVWQVDFTAPKLHPLDAKLGALRRVFLSVAIDDSDAFGYFGTSTGDIVKISIDRNEIQSYKDPDTKVPAVAGVSKYKFVKGAQAISICGGPLGEIVSGGGDGKVALMDSNLALVRGYEVTVSGSITSISKARNGSYMVGTDQCNRYHVSNDIITALLEGSSHCTAVNDVSFPSGCADLLMTCSSGDLRIWLTKNRSEILRVQVPNIECICAAISNSGSSILSGWADGKVRCFYPNSGKIKFVIPEAHSDRVTALALADTDHGNKSYRLITGGGEGRVRVWHITPQHQKMIISLKEHRASVNKITVNEDNTQCISASGDGSCIIWDLNKYVRITALLESNLFHSVLYQPDESQLLTCGKNNKITYWDSYDGRAIRVIDGGSNALAIFASGDYFVSGSRENKLKLWHYDDGIPIAIGEGHCGNINALTISPDEYTIVSVGSAGEIIFWEVPSSLK